MKKMVLILGLLLVGFIGQSWAGGLNKDWGLIKEMALMGDKFGKWPHQVHLSPEYGTVIILRYKSPCIDVMFATRVGISEVICEEAGAGCFNVEYDKNGDQEGQMKRISIEKANYFSSMIIRMLEK